MNLLNILLRLVMVGVIVAAAILCSEAVTFICGMKSDPIDLTEYMRVLVFSGILISVVIYLVSKLLKKFLRKPMNKTQADFIGNSISEKIKSGSCNTYTLSEFMKEFNTEGEEHA